MKKRTFLLSILTFISVCFAFTSCSNDELDFQLLEEQQKAKPALNKATSEFKSSLVTALKSNQSRVAGEDMKLSDEQISILKEKSLKMFKSHGFTQKKLNKLGIKEDWHLISSAAVLTALMESPAQVKQMKTRIEYGVCYDPSLIVHCLVQATGIHIILEQCLDAMGILQLLGKYGSLVGGAIFAYDFSHCMGWI